jgi:hypothetical protein
MTWKLEEFSLEQSESIVPWVVVGLLYAQFLHIINKTNGRKLRMFVKVRAEVVHVTTFV